MIGKLDLAVRVSALNMKLTSRQMYVELGSEDGKVYLDLWRMAGDSEERKVLCLADGLNYREMLAVLRALLLWEEVS